MEELSVDSDLEATTWIVDLVEELASASVKTAIFAWIETSAVFGFFEIDLTPVIRSAATLYPQ